MLARLLTLAIMLGATSVVAPSDDYNPQFRWALASKGLTVATSADELTRLNESTSDEDRVLYARIDGHEYLIREAATLDRVDQLVEPIRKLSDKVRQLVPSRGDYAGDKLGRREWKARLRPFKEKRRELLRHVSGDIEALARDAVRRGQAQRLP